VTVGVGGAMGDATKIDMNAWDRDFRINVTSMVLMARHTIPEFRKIGRGAIVNMSSVSGRKSQASLLPLKVDRVSSRWESKSSVPYYEGCNCSDDSSHGCPAWT
jgi:NAD(P)-dependent dehydrogenase (short-subunit alcohol dehydrogenase family)